MHFQNVLFYGLTEFYYLLQGVSVALLFIYLFITFAASLSERRRYCGARRLCVSVSVRQAATAHRNAQPRLQARRTSRRGEGNALYPVLFGLLFNRSEGATQNEETDRYIQ